MLSPMLIHTSSFMISTQDIGQAVQWSWDNLIGPFAIRFVMFVAIIYLVLQNKQSRDDYLKAHQELTNMVTLELKICQDDKKMMWDKLLVHEASKTG